MPGAHELERLRRRVQDRVERRGHGQRAEVPHQGVDPVEDGGRGMAVGRVGAHGGAQLGHDGGCLDPVPDHVADGHGDAAAREREDVVPVPAEAAARGGEIAGGGLEAGDVGEPGGQEPALHRLGHPPLLVEACLFDGEGGAVAGELEEVAFVVGEFAWGEAADVQDAEDACLRRSGGRRAGT